LKFRILKCRGTHKVRRRSTMCSNHEKNGNVVASVAGSEPPYNPAALAEACPRELHKIAIRSYAAGNRLRLKFLAAILTIEEHGHWSLLGAASIFEYCFDHFGYHNTKVSESLRVARALRSLPACVAAFSRGKMHWSILREITRVATPAKEKEWIDFAEGKSTRHVRAEVNDALEGERTDPIPDRGGLPRTTVRLWFDLTSEEHDLVLKALRKALGEIEKSTAGEAVELKHAFLLMARLFLETDPEGLPKGRVARNDSLYSLLYHICVKCRQGHAMTDDGPVEMPPEVMARVAAVATHIEMRPEEEAKAPEAAKPAQATKAKKATKGDTSAAQKEEGTRKDTGGKRRRVPTPRWMRRRLLVLYGHRCANPHCRRKLGCQAHHIVHVEDGGPTTEANMVILCKICHSLHHSGHITIQRDPKGELRWITAADRIELDIEGDIREEQSIPLVVPVAAAAPAAGGKAQPAAAPSGERCAIARAIPEPGQGAGDEARFAELWRALEANGFTKRDARERVERVQELYRGKELPGIGALLFAGFSGRLADFE